VDVVIQILVTGITLGAMYALATIGLSLLWGSLGMLNMAHGAMLTFGGYIAFTGMVGFGLPVPVALLMSLVAGALFGLCIYYLVVRQMLRSPAFETNVIIATVGLAIALENGILQIYGGQPFGQPLTLSGSFSLGAVNVPYQNLLIVLLSLVLMSLVAWLLKGTRMGRAIRAVAQNREAAKLMGVPVDRVFAQVLALAGLLAAFSGVLLSSITMLSPTLGADPMLKAFIMCVVAGLGNIPGSILAAFALAILEAAVQYLAGARWGFPALLGLVIVALIWRPYGVFGRIQVRRL
jgi:branched-chain amino acid transport system permease protein